MLARLSDVPMLVWVIVGLLLLTGARYVQLRLRRRRNRAVERRSVRGLRLLHHGLTTFARFNDDRVPTSLDGDDWAFARAYAFCPVPRWGFDSRLVIAYDRDARHQLMEFPMLRLGRAVLLATGKIAVVSEAQFEQLLAADKRLRAKLAESDES